MTPTNSSMQLDLEDLEKDLPREQDRYFAGKLISQLQGEIFAKKRRIGTIVSRWTIAYEYLKDRQFDILGSENKMEFELKHFYSTVSILHGLGELLLAQLEHHEIDIKELFGITPDDIDACVEDLADIVRFHREDMTQEMKMDLEEKVFGI